MFRGSIWPDFCNFSSKFPAMRKNWIFPLAIILILFSGCRGLRELKTLTKCQFRMGTLDNALLAGVNVQRVRSFEDINLLDAGRVLKSLAGGALPLSFTLNVEAKNPNAQQAAMGRMEWIALIDGVEIVRGANVQRVVLPANGGTATIPLMVRADLLDVLSSSEKRERLLNFGLNLTGQDGKPSRVSLKIKPSIKVGQKSIPYPGYFTVKKDFSGS